MSEAMKKRTWPFPGDAQIVRARKVGLAYRHLATEVTAAEHHLLDLIAKIDPRIVEWIEDDEFKTVHKLAQTGAHREAKTAVTEMDERFWEWGEDWHANVVRSYDDDEWINIDEAAAILCLKAASVSRARARGRLHGKLVKEYGSNAKWYFLAGDVYRLQNETRSRSSQPDATTDSIADSGSSDAA